MFQTMDEYVIMCWDWYNLVACENYLKTKNDTRLTSKNRIFDKYSKFTAIDN